MPRIAGVNIPDHKRAEIGLSYVYGLGLSKSQGILQHLKITGNPKFNEMTVDQIDSVRNYIEKEMTVEGDLKQMVQQNIRRLKEIASYRGARHAHNLPVHGQRTKTNARTKRGKKVTVGSGRKKSSEKT
ncbi:MAG: 30S ribosomal protein S13 [bacterium]|nr:30S ribosomal protein S13 [bacterium]